jgi:hypothetical protein
VVVAVLLLLVSTPLVLSQVTVVTAQHPRSLARLLLMQAVAVVERTPRILLVPVVLVVVVMVPITVALVSLVRPIPVQVAAEAATQVQVALAEQVALVSSSFLIPVRLKSAPVVRSPSRVAM